MSEITFGVDADGRIRIGAITYSEESARQQLRQLEKQLAAMQRTRKGRPTAAEQRLRGSIQLFRSALFHAERS
ncbi:MAG: hypothetical protein H6642_00040 [Caldilineaceae bacterium]|nr:hypothetical protein [Caldilineaceae bacterium]